MAPTRERDTATARFIADALLADGLPVVGWNAAHGLIRIKFAGSGPGLGRVIFTDTEHASFEGFRDAYGRLTRE